MIGIINASPLIYLGKIGALKLLPKLFSQIYTTIIVKEEVIAKKNTPEYHVLAEAFIDWLKIKEPLDQNLKSKLSSMQIHPGEASIIALGLELKEKAKKNVVIIDDLTTREIGILWPVLFKIYSFFKVSTWVMDF